MKDSHGHDEVGHGDGHGEPTSFWRKYVFSVDHKVIGIQYLITSDTLPWGTLMAGAVLSALPVVLLYFLAQRFMVQGMTQGSVKG